MIPITSPKRLLTCGPKVALFNSKGIIDPTEFNLFIISSVGSGQPLFEATPAVLGHLSS